MCDIQHYICVINQTKQQEMTSIKIFKCLGREWSIYVTSYGYIHITNLSLPRHMQFGRSYQNWDEVYQNYKSADMKIQLLMIESELNSEVNK